MTVMAPEKGSSNRNIKYVCTACGRDVGRDGLTVKRVEFATMGRGWKRLRSRTVAWLCTRCRNADPAWNAEEFTASPGLADVRDEP